MVIMILQAPKFAEQLQQQAQSVSCLMGGSWVTHVPSRVLRLCECRRQVCPCVGEGSVRRMEEGSCHIGGLVSLVLLELLLATIRPSSLEKDERKPIWHLAAVETPIGGTFRDSL